MFSCVSNEKQQQQQQTNNSKVDSYSVTFHRSSVSTPRVTNILQTCLWGWGCSSVGRPSDLHAVDTGSIPRCDKDFSPRVNFQRRLFQGVRTPPCVIACICTCAHVKDPIVDVRIRWIMETLKHPACIVSWVVRLCRTWPSLGKATGISHENHPIGTIQL